MCSMKYRHGRRSLCVGVGHAQISTHPTAIGLRRPDGFLLLSLAALAKSVYEELRRVTFCRHPSADNCY